MSNVIVGDFCIARTRDGLKVGMIHDFAVINGREHAFLRTEFGGWITTCFVERSLCKPLIRFRPEVQS